MWMRRTTFILFTILVSVFAVVHVVAATFFLYWTYLWLDVPIHALGGAVVALGFLTVAPAMLGGTVRRGFLVTLSAVLMVGILWEIFEWSIGMRASETNYVGDTALDLVMDTVGACIGYATARVGALYEAVS